MSAIMKAAIPTMAATSMAHMQNPGVAPSLAPTKMLSTAHPPQAVSILGITGRRLKTMSIREGSPSDQLVCQWIASIWGAFSGDEAGQPARNRSKGFRAPGCGARSQGSSQQGHNGASHAAWSTGVADDEAGTAAAPRLHKLFPPLASADALDDIENEPPKKYGLQVDYAKLQRIAGKDRRLVVSWTTGGPKRWSIAHNLALSIRRNVPQLVSKFVFVALDRDAVVRAEAAGFQAVLNKGVGLKDDIWKMRWLIMATCVALNLEVLVVDSDIVFLSDPFSHFFFDADVEAMTDHFFPAEQLFATWLRPAEHINTGFVFVRPSSRVLDFLIEFIDMHYYEQHGPSERDGMDQRVFNKYVLSKFEEEPPEAVGLYENLTFSKLDWQAKPMRFQPESEWHRPSNYARSIPTARPVRVRLLDPVCISHGMNYFWLKAYKIGNRCGTLPPEAGKGSNARPAPPAVVHVNGVDPKMYFLRDRNLWYLDDWDERWHAENSPPNFVVYDHPQGLPLHEDFETLIAAIEVAAYFRRRLVLPNTMNCQNCPAYDVYRLKETMSDEPGCTYDYFAHANGLYEVYSRVKPFAVEAGIAKESRFLQLLETSSWQLPSLGELQQTGSLRDEVLALQDTPRRAAFAEYRVLRVAEDMQVLRNALRDGTLGFRMNAERVFSCAYQQPLIGAMACLDEPYVEEFGEDAMCPATSFQEGCGPVGICCCWPFWGWGEKLQYFTGVRWDLPCNCGVQVCDRYERNAPQGLDLESAGTRGEVEQCCRHAGTDALFPNVDAGVFYCKDKGDTWQGSTAPEDSHTYTSYVYSEFETGKRTPAQTFETCRKDRMLRRGDALPEVSLRECGLRISAYLLQRSAWTKLQDWLQWQLEARRGLGSSFSLVVSMDIGNQTDNTGFSHGKLDHDVQQLEYIVNRHSSAGTPHVDGSVVDVSWLASEVLARYRNLARRFDNFRRGRETREAVELEFASVQPYFNRAVHVPATAGPEGSLLHIGGTGSNTAKAQLRHSGFVVVDDVLTAGAYRTAHAWFAESTVFYRSLGQDGSVLKAQLRDGLHAEFGTRVARELREQLGFAKQPLLDVVAYKYDETGRGIPPHCVDGVVGAVLWLSDDSADGESSLVKHGLRIFDAETSSHICRNHRVGPPPAASSDPTNFITQDKMRSVGNARRSKGAVQEVRFRQNRLVLWSASRAVELVHDGASWGKEFDKRRVDWILLFGRPRSDLVHAGQDDVASFEGKPDAWGGHYYAQDHDHR